MIEPSNEDIAEALRLVGSRVTVEQVRRWHKGDGIAELYWHHARTIAQLRVAVEAWSKVLPIRVQDGPDYAEVYFSDGTAHSTQAMTMNPQDWRDLAETLHQIRSNNDE